MELFGTALCFKCVTLRVGTLAVLSYNLWFCCCCCSLPPVLESFLASLAAEVSGKAALRYHQHSAFVHLVCSHTGMLTRAMVHRPDELDGAAEH